ncbi:DUF3761 domain-containing protein [Dyella flava]|uniref:DUF3761 domain-containing protein n=1 Tax=Dyella flava TaxID=1920170 RepID=A0ABS2JYK2_9GAMM|nr:DUF3761 domain-containing protein [Dyella flava]
MRTWICLFLLLALGVGATAAGQQAQPGGSPQGTQSVTNGSTQLIEQGSYVNRDGVVVHSPAHTVSGAAPSGASARCRDGSYSFSLHHSGTCSHHGGVSEWLK